MIVNQPNMKSVARASRELGLPKDQIIAMAEERVRTVIRAKYALTDSHIPGFFGRGLALVAE